MAWCMVQATVSTVRTVRGTPWKPFSKFPSSSALHFLPCTLLSAHAHQARAGRTRRPGHHGRSHHPPPSHPTLRPPPPCTEHLAPSSQMPAPLSHRPCRLTNFVCLPAAFYPDSPTPGPCWTSATRAPSSPWLRRSGGSASAPTPRPPCCPASTPRRPATTERAAVDATSSA